MSGKTIFQEPPSPEVDLAWDNLYRENAINLITEQEADQLSPQTMRAPNDPDHFVMGLSVFHQLHCLNLIRKSLYPEYYHNASSHGSDDVHHMEDHRSHCIELLRQVLVCASDTSVVTWRWVDEMDAALPLIYNEHTCRDFDQIREWAVEHRAPSGWDDKPSIHLGHV
ncbi:hypothetical protein BX600DRAFT_511086 [Xylariales sp. PMI_506]|nr:hypothetical protein BX600DRAFT_511086 [Xylariales sp. PMI_506]